MSTPHVSASPAIGPGGRPEAAAAIWSPVPRAEAGTPAPGGNARRRGTIRALVAAAVGGGLVAAGLVHLGTAVLVFATVVGLSALVSPGGLYAGIEALFAWTGRAAGRLVSWLVLVPTFYLFFLPFGLLMRRGRRDRLRRFTEPEAASYWTDRSARPASSPTRQY